MDSKRKNTSIVWNYFTEIDKINARCNFCKKLFSHKTSITNLKRHLTKKHPSIQIVPPTWRQPRQPQYGLKIEEINMNDPNEDTNSQPFQIEFVEVREESATSTTSLTDNQLHNFMNSKRKRTSVLWNYFTEIDKTKASCNLCKKLVSYRTSITNLKSHLINKHRTLKTTASPHCQPTQPQYTGKMEENHVNDQTNEFAPVCSTQEEFAELPKESETSNTSLTHNQLTPALMKDKLLVSSKLSTAQNKVIDDQLLKMITKDFQPLSIVENEDFRQLCRLLNPHYEMPSRKFVSNTLLPEKYLEVVNKAKQLVKHATTVTLTTDYWTSCEGISFIALTAHFINTDFEMQSLLLDVSSFDRNDTSDCLALELERIATEWGIEKDNILLAISDNVADIKQAISENLQWRHWLCLIHTINSIMRDALKKIESFTAKVREVVLYFRRNTAAKNELNLYQEQNYQEHPKKLILSDSTRCKSDFDMFQRFVELKEAILASLEAVGREDILLSIEFDTLQEIVEILAPLELTFTTMNGDQYVTLSSVIILTNCLRNVYQELEKQQFSDLASAVIRQVISGLNAQLNNVESNITLIVSTYLDPRYKNVGFSNETVAEAAKTKVISLLTDLIEKNNSNCEEKFDEETSQSTAVQADPASWLFQSFDEKASSFEPPASSKSTAVNELQRYLNEPLLPRDKNPLSWWKNRTYNYPNLSIIFKENFGTVATSVPPERILSKEGQLLLERRSRMSSLEKLRKILFINQNE